MTGLFRARWTDDILDEMVNSIARRRPDLHLSQLEQTRRNMCKAVPDCLTTGYQHLLASLELPDPDDRHVLAAAIRAGTEVNVTENLSDFPSAALAPYDIEAQSPDTFVLYLTDLAPETVANTVRAQASVLTSPPMTVDEVLEHLARTGLPRSVASLRSHT